MPFFKFRKDVIARSYDISNKDFVALPSTNYSEEEKQRFHWEVGLAKDIFAILASIFIAAIGYGMLAVMIAFKMENFIKNEFLISISSAVQICSGIIVAKFLPSLGRKLGLIHTMYFGTMLSALSGFLVYSYSGYFIWLITVFLIGTSSFICGVVRQTMTIDLAPPHIKATIISVSGMLFAVGNSLGPILLKLINTAESFTSFIVIFGILTSSLLPLRRLTRIEAKVRQDKKVGLWRYIKNSPKIMFASFSANYSMASCSAFIIIYGLRIGMDQESAALLFSVLLFGSIFSIPLGYLTDTINRRFLMIFSATMAIICSHFLVFNHDLGRIYFLIFLMFGCMIGIKLPALILINEKYKPTQRLAVNSAFGRMALFGNLCGIFTTGYIMKCCGPNGLWISIALIMFTFIIFCSFNYLMKMLKGEFDLTHFHILNKHKDMAYEQM